MRSSKIFRCPSCGKEVKLNRRIQLTAVAVLAILFVLSLVFSLPAIAAVSLFFLNTVSVVPEPLPKNCSACNAKLKEKKLTFMEMAVDPILISILPVFLFVNHLTQVANEYAFVLTMVFTVLWMIGFIHRFLPKGEAKKGTNQAKTVA